MIYFTHTVPLCENNQCRSVLYNGYTTTTCTEGKHSWSAITVLYTCSDVARLNEAHFCLQGVKRKGTAFSETTTQLEPVSIAIKLHINGVLSRLMLFFLYREIPCEAQQKYLELSLAEQVIFNL